MSIGENIRDRRVQIGMTQTALAGEAKVTVAAISQFESNVKLPNAYTFAAISKALGLTMDELMYGKKDDGVKK